VNTTTSLGAEYTHIYIRVQIITVVCLCNHESNFKTKTTTGTIISKVFEGYATVWTKMPRRLHMRCTPCRLSSMLIHAYSTEQRPQLLRSANNRYQDNWININAAFRKYFNFCSINPSNYYNFLPSSQISHWTCILRQPARPFMSSIWQTLPKEEASNKFCDSRHYNSI
jgi:hypothetical protein